MRVLTAAQMREVDRLTTERYKIPGLILMESAAARTVEAIERRLGPVADKFVKVYCGKGNNGGDGAAIARQLWTRGAVVDVLLLGRVEETAGDARANFEIARALAEPGAGLGFRELLSGDELWDDSIDPADVYVDAIFGTGLARPAEGLFAEAIAVLNDVNGAPVVSVDVPSGLASDSPAPIGPHVRAALTVTFTAPKPANVLPPACFAGGALEVGLVGSPDDLLAEACAAGDAGRLALVTPEVVAAFLAATRRRGDAHKGDAGRVLVVAGSRGKTGAAAMAGLAALRAGAGLVIVATPESAEAALAARCTPEVMTHALSETSEGTLSLDARDELRRLAAWADVVAIGPGLGQTEETAEAVLTLAREREEPFVIDADGLNCLAPWPDELKATPELPVIITPHPAEMARLLGSTTEEVAADRVAAARELATRAGVVTVLKGSRTVVAGGDGSVYINPTGNAGMATGGTGDVLTGVAAALACNAPDPALAAIAAVYVHGLAGDLAAGERGMRALVATDVAAYLGRAFIEAGGAGERP